MHECMKYDPCSGLLNAEWVQTKINWKCSSIGEPYKRVKRGWWWCTMMMMH